MNVVVRQGLGLGALSVSDQQRLEAASTHVFDLIDAAGRDIGAAHTGGLISDDQASAFEARLTAVRGDVDDLSARLPILAAQEIPAAQDGFDSAERKVSQLSADIRSGQSSGISRIVTKTGLWSAVAIVAAGAGAFWVVKYATKKSRRRRR